MAHNWVVLALDVDDEELREGYDVDDGWEPFAVVLRGTQPVLLVKTTKA